LFVDIMKKRKVENVHEYNFIFCCVLI